MAEEQARPRVIFDTDEDVIMAIDLARKRKRQTRSEFITALVREHCIEELRVINGYLHFNHDDEPERETPNPKQHLRKTKPG